MKGIILKKKAGLQEPCPGVPYSGNRKDPFVDIWPSRRASWNLFMPNISDEEIKTLRRYLFFYRTLNEDPAGKPNFAPNFIGGSWRGSKTRETLNAHFDRRVPIIEIPDSGAKETEEAIGAAYGYWTSLEWTKETLAYRKWVIQNLSRILNYYYEDCLREIRHQIPKTRLEADKDFWEAKRSADHLAGAAEKVMESTVSPQMIYGHHYWRNQFLPVGVSTILTPMNFIYGIPVIQLAAAYLAGVPIIFKGHPFAAITNTTLVRMFLAAGADPRSIQKIEGFGKKIEGLATDPRVARVSLTGSNETAEHIQNKLPYPDKLFFEGGGCNWAWIDGEYSHAELVRIAERLSSAKLSFSSHKCTTLHGIAASRETLDRLLPLLEDEFEKWKITDPRKTEENKVIGPIMVHEPANVRHIQVEMLSRPENETKDTLAGVWIPNEETRYGKYAAPQIIPNITPESEITINWDKKGERTFKLATTELFLPVLVTMEMNFERFINFCLFENPHSLSTSLYTRDSSKIESAKRLLGGMLKINDGTDGALEWEEFGGSGIGPSGNMGVGEAETTIKIFCRKQKGRFIEF